MQLHYHTVIRYGQMIMTASPEALERNFLWCDTVWCLILIIHAVLLSFSCEGSDSTPSPGCQYVLFDVTVPVMIITSNRWPKESVWRPLGHPSCNSWPHITLSTLLTRGNGAPCWLVWGSTYRLINPGGSSVRSDQFKPAGTTVYSFGHKSLIYCSSFTFKTGVNEWCHGWAREWIQLWILQPRAQHYFRMNTEQNPPATYLRSCISLFQGFFWDNLYFTMHVHLKCLSLWRVNDKMLYLSIRTLRFSILTTHFVQQQTAQSDHIT